METPTVREVAERPPVSTRFQDAFAEHRAGCYKCKAVERANPDFLCTAGTALAFAAVEESKR